MTLTNLRCFLYLGQSFIQEFQTKSTNCTFHQPLELMLFLIDASSEIEM